MSPTPARRTAGVLAAACVAALALTACQDNGTPPPHDTTTATATANAGSSAPTAPSGAPSTGPAVVPTRGSSGGTPGKINISAFLTPERIPLFQQYRWEYGQQVTDPTQSWLWFEQRCQTVQEQLQVAVLTEAMDINPTTGTKSPSSPGTADFKGRATIGVPRDAVQGSGLAGYLFRAVSASLKGCSSGRTHITTQTGDSIAAVITFPGGQGTMHEYIATSKGNLSELSLWDAPSAANPEHVKWPAVDDRQMLATLKQWLCTNQGC